MSDNILEINSLSVIYNSNNDKLEAVDHVSLALKKGKSYGLIGESGSGKSSLALSIMGVIEDAEISGEIIYNKENLLKLSNSELNKYRWNKIAMIFQNLLEVLNPLLTVEEQIIEVIRENMLLNKKEEQQRVKKLLEMVKLDQQWKDVYPHQLSGGMRQRVLIAIALACKPEILIIDEVTSSLDPETKGIIINLLKRLQEKYKFTSIIISHDMNTVKEMTSELIVMYRGNFIEQGLTAEIIKEPEHPYTRGLLNSSASLFPHKDLWGIKSEEKDLEVSGCPFYGRCSQRSENCKINKPELQYVGLERKVACNKGGIIQLLEAVNISKNYTNNDGSNFEVIKDVNLEVRGGEIAVLVGKSGSGKSTLAHILAGIKEFDTGKILFKGKNINDFSPTNKMKGMQIVFQDPFSATSDRLSVLEVVREPLDIIKWKHQKIREEKAVELIKMVELPIKREFLNRSCRKLSGGQRQRISIARALITAPELLIADEITSMLDPSVQANIIRKLKELQNKKGFSMLYITHNIYLAKKIADKSFIMEKGKVRKDDINRCFKINQSTDNLIKTSHL